MELMSIAPTAVLRSGSVAPTSSRLRGELRPWSFVAGVGDDVQATGGAGMATGYRSWSPPIT